MEFHEKLICLRKKQGLTQLELAEAVDVSRQAISKWEAGAAMPSLENLRSLSGLYSVPLDLLLNDELDLPGPSEAAPEAPLQQDAEASAGESPLGGEIRSEIKSLKKWVVALAAAIAVLALVMVVYIAGALLEGSDAIPIDELEEEYVGFSFDEEFDHGW